MVILIHIAHLHKSLFRISIKFKSIKGILKPKVLIIADILSHSTLTTCGKQGRFGAMAPWIRKLRLEAWDCTWKDWVGREGGQ